MREKSGDKHGRARHCAEASVGLSNRTRLRIKPEPREKAPDEQCSCMRIQLDTKDDFFLRAHLNAPKY